MSQGFVIRRVTEKKAEKVLQIGNFFLCGCSQYPERILNKIAKLSTRLTKD